MNRIPATDVSKKFYIPSGFCPESSHWGLGKEVSDTYICSKDIATKQGPRTKFFGCYYTREEAEEWTKESGAVGIKDILL